MRLTRKQKKRLKKKEEKRKKLAQAQTWAEKRSLIKKKKKNRTINKDPYIFTFVYLPKNYYIIISNVYGEIFVWWSAARSKFIGRSRNQTISLITTTKEFLIKIRKLVFPGGILLKFQNLSKRYYQIKKTWFKTKQLFKRFHWKAVSLKKKLKKFHPELLKQNASKFENTYHKPYNILGIIANIQISFNGCRGRNLKRKKRRRRARIITRRMRLDPQNPRTVIVFQKKTFKRIFRIWT